MLMLMGRGGRRPDWAAIAADTLLGAVWVLFVWSVLAQLLVLTLFLLGVEDPARSRTVTAAVILVVPLVLVWGVCRGDSASAYQTR